MESARPNRGTWQSFWRCQRLLAPQILAAISSGAVYVGANTYIGNGPNFMVKAIAEENGVTMPGFFAYMLYAVCVLIPIFVVVTLVFFV